MKLLEKINNYTNKIKLLKLVDAGYKTGSVFEVGTLSEAQKNNLLLNLKKYYPNSEFYFHPNNERFLEFYNRPKFQLMLHTHFPEWVGLHNLEIIHNKSQNFNNPLDWEHYYGYFFDIPLPCITEFNYNQAPKERRYVTGFGGEISVYYISEKSKYEATLWIQSLESINL